MQSASYDKMSLSTVALLLQLVSTAPSPANAETLRAARAAQQRFESLRRMRLPTEWTRGSTGRCDARIGRFCYWYDSTESAPIAEPRAIVDARLGLLAVLDSLATRNPQDGWIAAQRVRYLVEAGRLDDAVAAGRACAAERWWCAALEGLALHVTQRYRDADSVFAFALAAMPQTERCEWQDIRELLEPPLERQLSRKDCATRTALGQRLLLLAQPLWMIDGNDLRTEVYARHTMARILARSASPQGSFGDDSRELLVRYGWSEWFTRQDGVGLYSTGDVTGHDREPSYAVFPDVRSVDDVARLTEGSWKLRAQMARSRYAPRALKRLSTLEHQVARFPHGDSVLLAVALHTSDTALVDDSIDTAVIVLEHDSLRRVSLAGTRGTTIVPNDTVVVSVEALGRRTRHAERARYTIDPLHRVGAAVLSDLLLYDATREPGDSLDAALAAALTDDRVSLRSPLGVYWEMEGVSSGPATMSLTVEPIRVSFARRVASRLRLARDLAPVRLQWEAVVASMKPQHVTLRLPDTARGTYRVQLSVQPTAGAMLTSSRIILVEP